MGENGSFLELGSEWVLSVVKRKQLQSGETKLSLEMEGPPKTPQWHQNQG